MVQGYLERTRSGLDDVLFASPAEVGASALNSCRPYKVPPHAFPWLAVTDMTVRMEVSIHATAGSFALSRQRARRPPRLEREFQNRGLP